MASPELTKVPLPYPTRNLPNPLTETAKLFHNLIRANHILDFHGLVDGYGFIAARNPLNPATYFIAEQSAPALISSPSQLIEHRVSDSTPLDPDAPASFRERFIMGELFRRYPEVNAAVHSHALEVLPFCVCDGEGPQLQPAYHMAGFLGNNVPVWDIMSEYENDKGNPRRKDLLVSDTRLGESLAKAFSNDPEGEAGLDRTVVLQKRHGYAVVGPDIETAVFRAVYTANNARVQREGMALQGGRPLAPMPEEIVSDCKKMAEASQFRSWALWNRVVESEARYRLSMD